MPIEARAGSTPLQFGSAAELQRALLAALEEGRGYGDPIVRVGWDDSEPAWQWLGGLLATRSDWVPAAGLALQQAVWSGDPLVREAFVDAMASVRQMVSLLPWTQPLAAALGPVQGRHARLDWAGTRSRPQLAEVVAGQQAWCAQLRGPDFRLPTEGWAGPSASFVPLCDEGDLRGALERTASRGRFAETEWGTGPAAWLHLAVLIHPWVDEALVRWVREAIEGSDGQRHLAFDWLLDGRDLWRHLELLEDLQTRPRGWSEDSTWARAPKWRRPLRVPRTGPATLGLVAARLRSLARAQAESPPRIDLGPVSFA